jgi:hypothetical protein
LKEAASVWKPQTGAVFFFQLSACILVLVWGDMGYGGTGGRAERCANQRAPLDRVSLAVETLVTVCVSEHRRLINRISTVDLGIYKLVAIVPPH